MTPCELRSIKSHRFVGRGMKIGLLILTFCFSIGQVVLAQEKVSPNQPVSRKVGPGKSEVFSITLNDGDYVNVSLEFKGKLNFFLLNPDGTIARRLVGRDEAKVSFPFAAEGAGAYSFKLENRGDQSATY